MKRHILLPFALFACLALASGCRTAGPYERHFRFTAAPVPVPAVAADGAAVAAVPPAQVAEETWEVPDEPVLPVESIVTAELSSADGVAAWLDAGWTEIGRAEFVSTRVPARSEAVAFAARLGAPGVLFFTEDLGAHWFWRTEWEPRRVRRFVAPPPHGPPPPGARHRPGPPPPVFVEEVDYVPVDRLRVERHYRNLAVFLGGAAEPETPAAGNGGGE